MVVGKPNFNLNSYGIKYFQKGEDSIDEVDERTDDKVNTVTTGGGLKQPTKLDTELGSINTQLNTGQNNITVGKKPKFKPSKAKVKPNISASTSASLDNVRAENAKKLESDRATAAIKPDKKTDYYYNKPAKVNHYLGEDKQDNDVALSPAIGGVKTDHAPADVPQGKSARERWNEKHPKAAKKLVNQNRTGDSKGQGAHVAETRKPSSGAGAREEFLNREGVGEDDDDKASAHKNKVPLNEQVRDSKAVKRLKRDVKNVNQEPNIDDKDKKDLTGGQKKVTTGKTGNANELYEKIHGHKYTEKPAKSEEEKRNDYKRELRGNLSIQEEQREEAKKKEIEATRKRLQGKKFQDTKMSGEEIERNEREDEETDAETTSRAHTGKYRDVQPMEDQPKGADDSKGGYRKDFSNVEAMDIAHKRTAERTTAKEDEKDKKAKERREAILDHVGDKKPDNNSSLKPQPKGDRKESNVSIQHTEDKVNEVTGKTIPATQTKEQAATNEKVRQVREVTEMEKEKERKAQSKETEELKHDEKGNWKENYTPTAEEKAKKKKERLEREAAAAKKKDKPKTKKTKKKEPESKLSEEQMKKLMDDKAARDKNKTANGIIMDMAILKLDLMKDAKDGITGKKLEDPFNDQGFDKMEGNNHTFANEMASTRYEGYMDDYKGDDEPSGTTFNKLDEVGTHDNEKIPSKFRNNMTSKQPIKPKIASAADETIFKAISLKLDLM